MFARDNFAFLRAVPASLNSHLSALGHSNSGWVNRFYLLGKERQKVTLFIPIKHLILLSLLLLVSACQATVEQLEQQQAVYDIAKKWYLKGDLLAAEQQLNQLHSRRLDTLQSWRLMGNIQFRQQRLEAAEYAYRQALQIEPGDAFSWHNLTLVNLRQTTNTLMRARSQLGQLDAENDALLRQLLGLQRVQLR